MRIRPFLIALSVCCATTFVASVTASTAHAAVVGDRCQELKEEIAALKRAIRNLERQIDELEDQIDQAAALCQQQVDRYHQCLDEWYKNGANGAPPCDGSLSACTALGTLSQQLRAAEQQLAQLKQQLDDAEDEFDDLDCPGNIDIEDIIIRRIGLPL